MEGEGVEMWLMEGKMARKQRDDYLIGTSNRDGKGGRTYSNKKNEIMIRKYITLACLTETGKVKEDE